MLAIRTSSQQAWRLLMCSGKRPENPKAPGSNPKPATRAVRFNQASTSLGLSLFIFQITNFPHEKKKKLNFGSEETQFLIQKHGLERITSGDQNKTCSCQVALSLLIRNNNCPRSPTRWPPTQRSFSQSRVTQSPAPAWEIIFLGRYLSPWWGGNPVNKEEKWISRTPPAAWH